MKNIKETTNIDTPKKEANKNRWYFFGITTFILLITIIAVVLKHFELQNITYGGNFYREGNKVFIDDPKNTLLKNIELPNADPKTFRYLQGLAGYDKNNFHYLKYDYETGSYIPESVPISSEIKQLFDLVESPGNDVKIVWISDVDISFENVTYKRLPGYGDSIAFRIELFEILNNNYVVGYLWTNGINKINVVNNKIYLYVDSIITDFKRGVYEVTYGKQPEMLLEIYPNAAVFKFGSNNIYYTKSYDSLELYEYDIFSRTERKIPVKYQGNISHSSRITLSPDEKYLLVQVVNDSKKIDTLLININTGDTEIVREKEKPEMGGDLPFAISPNNNRVFFLEIPYEGYLFANPYYVEKNEVTGKWGKEIKIYSINMEVGGGWNVDTNQWAISPSGKYLAIADASEDSIFYCGGSLGELPRAHNIIKIFDMETLETQVLVEKAPNEDFNIKSWAPDESGVFTTKYNMEIDMSQDCGDFDGKNVQEFYLR